MKLNKDSAEGLFEDYNTLAGSLKNKLEFMEDKL